MFIDLSYVMEQVMGAGTALRYSIYELCAYCQDSVGAFGCSFPLEDR